MSGMATTGQDTWCVRCGGELPARTDNALLYCPHCGAPQLILPDYLRAITPEIEAQRARTTGMVPPPRPRLVDWQAVLRCAGVIGAVGAVLMTLGLLLQVMATMGMLWMLACGIAGAWLYARVRPHGGMDARIGVRVGVVCGLVTVTLVSVVLTLGGLVNRFVLHRGQELDEFVTQGIAVLVTALKSQPGSSAFNEQALAVLTSPEGRAGYMLVNFVFDAAFVVGLAAALGAIAGTLARRRSQVGRTF